jgi:hypothetical protein
MSCNRGRLTLALFRGSLVVAGWFTLALFKESLIVVCVFFLSFHGSCSWWLGDPVIGVLASPSY